MKIKIKIILWISVFLWMCVIFAFSSQEVSESRALSGQVTQKIVEITEPDFNSKGASEQAKIISSLQHVTRKTAHILLYFVLGILCMIALIQYSWKKIICFGAALGICIVYASTDEFHQIFISGRGPQIRDVFIDICGALIGILLTLLLYKLKSRRCVSKKNTYE